MSPFLSLIKSELSKVNTLLNEVRAVKKRMIRGGKLIRKRDCPPGYTLKDGRRCVRQKARERIKRRRAGIKAARKGKAARRRNIKKANRIRKRRKLKRIFF